MDTSHTPEFMTIPLTRGYIALVDPEDYPSVAPLKWTASVVGNKVYAVHYFRSMVGRIKSVSMHRFITAAPANMTVDHADGDGLNNRRKTNLRICTMAQNLANRRISFGKRFKGVSMTPYGTYRVMVAGKYLGSAKTIEDAARMYDAEALRLWGEFAKLNFPVSAQSA